MTQITVVQVDFASQEVLGTFPMDPKHIPDAPQGSYYLVPGVDFPATTIVSQGQIWDGTRDLNTTSFSDPAPVDMPTTQSDAIAAARALMQQVVAMLDHAEAIG